MKEHIYSQEYITDTVTMKLFLEISSAFIDVEGDIFYKFPEVKELDSPVITPDVFIISPEMGLVFIIVDDLSADRNNAISNVIDKADKIDASIFSSLIKERHFQKDRRSLRFDMTMMLYLPNYKEEKHEYFTTTSSSKIVEKLRELPSQDNFEERLRQEVLSILEAANATIKPKERALDIEDTLSKAYALKCIESQIAKLDDGQRKAALSQLDGPQRIRGLAGSGKTIVLCLKAAYLHLHNPEKRILYTFYTRSLYDYIRQLITRYYMKISDGQIPDFEHGITILHAWGGRTIPGVYSYASQMNGLQPMSYSEAIGKDPKDSFGYVCHDFIERTQNSSIKLFDYVLMDEAQDYSAAFYQLCRSIVRDDHLVWGYDELQNIFDVKLQNTVDTFKNKFDSEGLDLEKSNKKYSKYLSNDIVLPNCYRNKKEILMGAIALGFGVYNKDGLIQSLENNSHWHDLGFDVIEGDCSNEEKVKIIRLDKNSPMILPTEYVNQDFIEFHSSENIKDEGRFVAEAIYRAISVDKLRADDIAVICLDDRNAKNYFSLLEELLFEKNIAVNNVMSKNYTKGFTLEQRVTLSSVYKAKGNEAAMVFVMGCDAFNGNHNNRNMRNKIFTAFTRAKLWLRITGIDIEASAMIEELALLKRHNYELCFFNKPHSVLERDWHEKTTQLSETVLAEQLEGFMSENGVTPERLMELLSRSSGQKG